MIINSDRFITITPINIIAFHTTCITEYIYWGHVIPPGIDTMTIYNNNDNDNDDIISMNKLNIIIIPRQLTLKMILVFQLKHGVN